MKKTALSFFLAAATTAFAQVPTADFTGFYEGVQLGSNQSKSSAGAGVSKTTTYPGLVAGYAVEQQGLLVGVEAFADNHNDSTTYKDAGVGLKVGKVFSKVLVYGRVGATGNWPSWRPQIGAGVEAKLNKNFSLYTFFSHDKATDSGITRENNSLVVGVNYYFR